MFVSPRSWLLDNAAYVQTRFASPQSLTQLVFHPNWLSLNSGTKWRLSQACAPRLDPVTT